MKSFKRLWLLVLLGGINLFAQQNDFDEIAFFDNLQNSYYTLSQTDTKNFVVWVTSLKMEIFAEKTWQNRDVFPLQLIWFNPDKIYLTQQGVPTLKGKGFKEYQELINGLKLQIKGILLDLQRFYLQGLYSSIGNDYVLKHNEQAVQITQTQYNDGLLTKIKYLFGYNGLLLYNEIAYPQQGKVITIYPRFKIVKDKWLCQGWKVQTYINGEVESGFNLILKNKQIDHRYVPTEINLEVQKSDLKGKTFFDQIKLVNYRFNQSIKLVERAKANP